MEMLIDFVTKYYIVFIIISSLLVLALIGYISNQRSKKDVSIKKKKDKKIKNKAKNSEKNQENQLNNEIIIENNNTEEKN